MLQPAGVSDCISAGPLLSAWRDVGCGILKDMLAAVETEYHVVLLSNCCHLWLMIINTWSLWLGAKWPFRLDMCCLLSLFCDTNTK